MILQFRNAVSDLSQRVRIQFGAVAVTSLTVAALAFGVLGAMFDRRKFFAVATTAITIAAVLYTFVCHWLATAYSNMLS